LWLLLVAGDAAQVQTPHVVLMQLTGRIDSGLVPYVRRVLQTAATQGAAAVIVRIDTRCRIVHEKRRLRQHGQNLDGEAKHRILSE
jgi:membrane-bound ClpP family serine protease